MGSRDTGYYPAVSRNRCGRISSGGRLERTADAAETQPASACGSSADSVIAGFPHRRLGGATVRAGRWHDGDRDTAAAVVDLRAGPETLSGRWIGFGRSVVVGPVAMVTAALIKLDSPGNVIFRQSRRGFNGKPFEIWKFRSMSRHGERSHDHAGEKARTVGSRASGVFCEGPALMNCRSCGTCSVGKCLWLDRGRTHWPTTIITIR